MSNNVSTSEVATFLTCKQRWMYAHHPSYNLEPRTLGIALTRGVVGHGALEVFYKAIMDGKSYTDAIPVAQNYLVRQSMQAMSVGDVDKITMITELMALFEDYFQEHKWLLQKFNIFGVENLVKAPLPEAPHVNFVGRIDLTLEEKKTGELVPWDHKFTYNFWSEKSIRINVQLPNYIWALNQMGHRSSRGILGMNRYRKDALERFKPEEVSTNATMRNTFIKNHTIAAVEIVNLKGKSTVDIEDGITRSSSKFNCEYCPFVELCYTEASGQDSTVMRKANFRKNSYGYDSVLDVE